MGYSSTFEAIQERLQISLAEAVERNRDQQVGETHTTAAQISISANDVKRIVEDVLNSILPSDLIAYLSTDAGKQQIYYQEKYQNEKNKSEALASKIDMLVSDKIEFNSEIELLEKRIFSLEKKKQKLVSENDELRVQLAKQKLEYDSKSLECLRVERHLTAKLEADKKENERKLQLARGQSVDDISRWQTEISNVPKKR